MSMLRSFSSSGIHPSYQQSTSGPVSPALFLFPGSASPKMKGSPIKKGERLFIGDLVRPNKVDDEHKSGIVSRVYQDEAHEDPRSFPSTGLDRRLKQDEAGVMWYPSGDRQLVSFTEMQLLDRSFHLGSNCKRSIKDLNTGVVTGYKSRNRLQHIFSKEEIDHLVPSDDLVKAISINNGDHVIVNDWVGEVDEVMEEGLISTPGSDKLVRVCDLGGRLNLGKVPQQLYHQHEITSNLGQLGINEPSFVDVRQTVLYINWLALNQKLTVEEQATRPKPPALWTDLEKLTHVKAFADKPHLIGDRVVFRSQELKEKHGGKTTYHGKHKFPVEAMLVLESHTEFTVLWQDGSTTTELGRDLIPHLNLDEHEAWPGDWVWWKSDDQDRTARIVQNMDPIERTAELRTPIKDPPEIETVPSLEIDVIGPDHSVFSLHRGDVVMLCSRSTGFTGPFLTTVGDPRPDYGDHEMRSAMFNAEMNVVAPGKPTKEPARKLRSASQASDIDWYGTVVDLLLDGRCQVRLPSGRLVEESLDKLLILSDTQFGIHEHDHLDDAFMDDEFDAELDDGLDTDEELDALWMDQDGQTIDNKDRGDWEDMSEDDETADGQANVCDSDSDTPLAVLTSQAARRAGASTVAKAKTPKPQASSKPPQAGSSHGDVEMREIGSGTTPAGGGDASKTLSPSDLATSKEEASWTQFAVLESAPKSHAFYSKTSWMQPGPAFFKRLQKEFKVLQSSLPDTILVRAYEDRTDLLRVLIFGSEGTPYENAPFLLDFQLTSDFPNHPPIAHFHSWTNDHGRVSPNLYEDGKVCLSILGTWSGQAEENWNPSKSSLLQVFVSIQALVLVREPYFTEPAYEKLKGTEESRHNSIMYNEKAYILSRGFIRRALERPPEGFEADLKHYYFNAGNLSKVLKRSETLIEQTSSGKMTKTIQSSDFATDIAVENLTKGGAIMLSRTAKALQSLLDAYEVDQST